MDKLAPLFLSCLLFASRPRKETWASQIPVEWMEKKPQMWLLWAVLGKRSGSAVSSEWLEDVQAERFLLTSLWVPCQNKVVADLGLYSKYTHPGAHLEFLLLCLSFHYRAGRPYPKGCTRSIKRTLWELCCISGFRSSSRVRHYWCVFVDLLLREFQPSCSFHFLWVTSTSESASFKFRYESVTW